MENEVIETVLKDMLEEQRKTDYVNEEMISAVNGLTAKVSNFGEHLKNQKIIVPETDTKPIQQIIEKCIWEIKMLLAESLKKVRVNNFRLFLESDAKKWVVILIIAIFFLTYLFIFCMHLSGR